MKTPSPQRRRASWRLALLVLPVMLAASACDPSFGFPQSITPQGHRARNLWIGSCIAASVVGGFVVLLIVFVSIRYRKRDERMPRQVRYNLPIELLYTVVPFIIVGALFFYTAKDEIYVQKVTKNPATHGVTVVDVEGFRWGWTFRYLDDSSAAGVPDPSQDAVFVTGSSRTVEPTLVVPENTPIQFQLHSNDVIHSFWVPQLLFKEDVIPGRTNTWEVSEITRLGTFRGHCAELCGEYHSQMNFELKVVTPQQYQQYLAALVGQGQYAPVPAAVTGSTPAGSMT